MRTPSHPGRPCSPATGCCVPAKRSEVPYHLRSVARRALRDVSDALGIPEPELRYFVQIAFHARFVPSSERSDRAKATFEAAEGQADLKPRRVWISAVLDPSEGPRVVAHELAHLIGADEDQAARYAEAAAGALSRNETPPSVAVGGGWR